MYYSDDDNKKVSLTPFPEWAQWLLLAGLVAAALAILFKVLRRDESGAVLAAVAPIVALSAARASAPVAEPIDATALPAQLRVIAANESLIPPTRLIEALRTQGVPLTSEQHMARELRKLGLRSEVRTVPGRPERRWYNLSEYTTHD